MSQAANDQGNVGGWPGDAGQDAIVSRDRDEPMEIVTGWLEKVSGWSDTFMRERYMDYTDTVAKLTSTLGLMGNLVGYRRIMFLAWRIHTGRIQECEFDGDTPTADRCERYMLSKTITIPVKFIP